jgi:hypothetical protein
MIKWYVSKPSDKHYRSFHGRQWPVAKWVHDDSVCATIVCLDDYSPGRAKSEEHAQLTMTVLLKTPDTKGENFTVTKVADSLPEAKKLLTQILKKYSANIPLEAFEMPKITLQQFTKSVSSLVTKFESKNCKDAYQKTYKQWKYEFAKYIENSK